MTLVAIVGNYYALRPDQQERVQRGEVLLVQEDYANEGWGWPAGSLDDVVAAYCRGTYPAKTTPDTVAGYRAAGRWKTGDGTFPEPPDPDRLP